MKITAHTDIGCRHTANEDTYVAGRLSDGTCWIVLCDGMGGVSAGREAGRFVAGYITAAMEEFFQQRESMADISAFMRDTVMNCNAQLCKISRDDSGHITMGTTVVFAIIRGGVATILHAGDSRAYHLSANAINCITSDHSMVQELVDSGKITEEQARNHPNRNIITSAIGIELSPKMDIDTVRLKTGESLLVCSDGLSNTLTDGELLKIKNESSFFDSARLMVRKAVERRVMDNVTAVIYEA